MFRRPLVRLAMAVLFALALPGCRARHDVDVTVRSDGSGRLALGWGLDGEARAALSRQGVDAVQALRESSTRAGEGAPPGSRQTAWSSGGFEGFQIMAPFRDLAELERLFGAPGRPGGFLHLERSGREFRFRFDAREYAEATVVAPARAGLAEIDGGAGGPEAEAAARALQARLVVRLPGRVVSSNADEVTADGRLLWHLLPPPRGTFRARTRLGDHDGRHVGPLGLALAVVTGAVALWLRKRKHSVRGVLSRDADAATWHHSREM